MSRTVSLRTRSLRTLSFRALSFRTLLPLIGLWCVAAAIVAAGAEVTEVKIDNFSFGPQTITVPAGTQVRWTNHDDIPHNAVSEDKLFKSTTLDTDQQFTYTFDKPGTYKYYCTIHPRMTGTIVVQ
jgi:plastocyanin